MVGLNLGGCASAFVAGLFTAFLSWATVAFVSVDLVPLLEIAGDSFLFDTSMFLLLLLLIAHFSNVAINAGNRDRCPKKESSF